METETIGLTKEEKVMFSILGIILTFAIGILIINSFSAQERKLTEEQPITEKEEKKTEEDGSNEDITLKEENTSNVTKSKIAYVTNLTTKKKQPSKLETTKKEIEKEETPVFVEWDYPEGIVTEAYANTTIKIDKNVILKDGSTGVAQVTIRKLIEDTYMIQDISSGELTLTEGTYKYYYTYADVTKELVLTVTGYLNPKEVTFPNIKDETEEKDKEYLLNLKETIKNSEVLTEENTVNLTLKESSKFAEIPLYLKLEKDLSEVSVTSNTFGIRVNKTAPFSYQELQNNELVMWINLETFSTTSTSEILIILDNVTYSFMLNLKTPSFEEVKKEEQDNIDDKEEENSNNDLKEENQTEQNKDALKQNEEQNKEKEENAFTPSKEQNKLDNSISKKELVESTNVSNVVTNTSKETINSYDLRGALENFFENLS